MANTQTRQSNESRMITNIDSTKTNEDNYRTALLGVKVCLAI